MSKRWSCGTLGEGYCSVVDESVLDDEERIEKELKEHVHRLHVQRQPLTIDNFGHLSFLT